MKKRTWFSKLLFPVLLLAAFMSGCAANAPDAPLSPDNTRPTVSFTAPANGQSDVPANRIISIAFSEQMDPATINTSTIRVTGPGLTPVTGTVGYVGTTATFTPTGNTLAFNTLYTVTITTNAKDLAGNGLAADHVFTFTTGMAPDTARPTVSIASPANTAIAVPINRVITIGFSEAMDPLTINATTITVAGPGATAVTGVVTPIGTSATFVPASNFALNTLYTVTVTTGAKDLAGNALASNFVSHFTTSSAPDTTKPTVIATVNANGATNVPTNTKVGATFSEVMSPLTINSATFTLKQGAATVPGTLTYSGVNAVFTPSNALANNTVYTVTVTTGAKDLAGNAMAADYVWSWTTAAAADTTAPTVTVVNPADLATNVPLNSAVHATFSKAMDPLTITTANFSVAGLTGVTGVVTYDAISKIATFTPSSNLAPSTTYTATITTGTADIAGNHLAVNKVWSFTTAASGVAPGAIALGSVGTFGIMATSAITNTGVNTKINGDVSLDPGTSNGLLPVQVNGTIHINDTVSAQARADLLVAYNSAKALPPGTTISAGADLGALYTTGIPPGTYTSGSTMLVSSPLILDGGGNANAVWVFQIGSSLTTGASVSLTNGAQAKNVFWVPTLDATIGVGTIFYGNIISGRSVTTVTGSTINGRILAGATTAGTIALQSTTVNVPAP